ncbi:MAG: ATPase, T2SS/T4P/T4SS family [Thermodesulfobacteriota bacterium]
MMSSVSDSTRGPKGRKKLGEYLVEAGLIDEKTLANALEIQRVEKKKVGQILIDMGVADDQEIAKALARQLHIPVCRLDGVEIPDEVISLIPAELVENYILIPVKKTAKGLLVAMANPLDLFALDDLRFVTQMPVEIAVAPQEDVLRAIGRYYPKKDLERDLSSGPDMGGDIEILHQKKEVEDKAPKSKDIKDILDLTERAPVVRFANAILGDAIRLKASDIHIEPQKTAVIIRYRVDGVLREVMKTDRHMHAALISRIKIIANMDISIRRKPQDGKVQVKYGARIYDLRVSSIPTSYGEKVTIRVLDPAMANLGLEDLNLSSNALSAFMEALSRPQGIILATGPTGSGKSSTLYACLNRLNTPKVNIITVEDPVEYDISGINQVQINPKAGITFASGLRSILRQDPDIVMVGEIRDAETAGIACQAAQTGHLVLSSLHTNDATSAVTRLMDLGIEPFMISDSLIAVVAQRLVRRICEECKVQEPLGPQILEKLGTVTGLAKDAKFWHGAGCEHCQYTGYSGRMGLFEVLAVTPEIKKVITTGVSAARVRQAAMQTGFHGMDMDGIEKAAEGLTTIEEVFRVAPPEVRQADQEAVVDMEVIAETREEKAPSEVLSASVGTVSPRKILVADDNELIIKILRNILENENYLTLTAGDGLEALRLALQEKPDLIITDLLMPKMDGLTLVKKLKSQLATRFIPVIMLTAKDEADLELKGIDAGADEYLTKPVNPKQLLAGLDRLINRANAA